MNIYLTVILASLVLGWLLNVLADRLTLSHLDPELPEEFKDVFDREKYRLSQEYARANIRLGLVSSTVSLAVLLAFILLGGFNSVDQALRSLQLGEIITGLLFFFSLGLAGDLLSLPFEVYDTFVLEERFGFNKTTPRLFIADKLKGYALAVIIGGPIAWAVLFFFLKAGSLAWLYAWAAVALVSLILQYLAPTLILPLFNKFTPLSQEEHGDLRDALNDYAHSVGLSLSGIFVMDGSKRSSKSNAFFTGFGNKKRIALFDTLIDKHETDEIMAILAHEAGHSKKRHVLWLTAIFLAKSFVLFLLMSVFLSHAGLFQAFGMGQASVHAGLLFFLLLFTPASMVLSLGLNALSRRFEFQADRFAAQTTHNGQAMIRALKKLSAHNLSNLTPHPFRVALSYSHPPVMQRIRAIRTLTEQENQGE